MKTIETQDGRKFVVDDGYRIVETGDSVVLVASGTQVIVSTGDKKEE